MRRVCLKHLWQVWRRHKIAKLFFSFCPMTSHKHVLKEVAKFASGLVVGDILALLWIAGVGLLPFNFWGMTFTAQMVTPAVIFDLLFLAVLVHYGWQAEVRAPSIKQRTFFTVVGWILTIVSLAHLMRVIFNVPVELGTVYVPFWLSWMGFIIAAYLAYASFHFANSR